MQAIKTLAMVVAACVAVSLPSVATAAKTTNSTMSVGDGTTVETNSTSTIFMGTEYNPNKCVLQFASVECKAKNCGELNGYPLECVSLGMQDGDEKMACECEGVDELTCQNSTNPDVGGVPQFGDCSGGQQCVDSYGHVPSSVELRVCAEKLHCVQEINSKAAEPAEICHTCRSCIAQNDAQDKKLTDIHRFDCTAICPKEILDELAERNKQNAGIADELSSNFKSTTGSGSGGSGDKAPASGEGADDAGSDNGVAEVRVSAMAVVSTVVVTVLSVGLWN